MWRPKNGVSMKISGWIEPQPKLLLSIALPLSVHIRMHRVRLPTQIPQELEVYLVVIRPLRRQLTDKKNEHKSQPQRVQVRGKLGSGERPKRKKKNKAHVRNRRWQFRRNSRGRASAACRSFRTGTPSSTGNRSRRWSLEREREGCRCWGSCPCLGPTLCRSLGNSCCRTPPLLDAARLLRLLMKNWFLNMKGAPFFFFFLHFFFFFCSDQGFVWVMIFL